MTAAPFTPRLPPVARGACRALHAAPPPLPESPPTPPEDAPVQEVLADQAAAVAKAVAETNPGLMQAARTAAHARVVDEAIRAAEEDIARPRTLTRWGYGVQPTAPDERAHIAMLRAAQCSGGAARLRPYMTGTHRADEARARHDELVAAEAEWKARAESERHPSRG